MSSESLSEAAINYREMGLSVIPVRKDKKPYIAWTNYQKEKASVMQIQKWWRKWPEANIGIVTGEISGIMVVDVDSEKGLSAFNGLIPDSLITPTSNTPRRLGRHFYFRYREGLSNRTKVLEDCDIRTDGGYIIAPPSVGENGNRYDWLDGLSITQVSLAAMPENLYSRMQTSSRGRGNESPPFVYSCLQASTDVRKLFSQGSRDNTLFNIAYRLAKGGENPDKILNYLIYIGSFCVPPFPEREIILKLQSALNQAKMRETNLADDVRDFVSSTTGHFLSTDVYNSLQVSTRNEKKNISIILKRLTEEGVIERFGNKNGCFRKVDKDCEVMDFLSAETEGTDILLPFGLHEMVEIMPGNIILLAGEPNSGKTGLLLNMIKDNMGKFKVHYFNSEMGESELKKRLLKFPDIGLREWKFKAWSRSGQFADVVKPGDRTINIIDFLEIHENFYEVSGMLTDIHKKLNGAIAIVALQKNKGQDIGLGGYRSLEKPRLYLSLSPGRLKIVKAKNYKTSENPNNKIIDFKMVNGCKLITTTGWHMEK